MVIIILGYFLGLVYITTASWPLYIDLAVFGLGMLLSIPYAIKLRSDTDFAGAMFYKGIVGILSGSISFILMFFWCDMNVSIWWYLLALAVGCILTFIPGGFSIASVLLKNWGVCLTLPIWVRIAIAVLDLINLILYFIAFSLKKRN